jgi:sugar lactone lactonase YvrE
MPRTLFLVALLLISQTAPKPGKLPVDKFPPALRTQAAEVQAAWDQYPDNACVLYQVAALYARSVNKQEALATLRDMADKHAGLDPRVRDGFQNLTGDPEFAALKQEIRRENPPVTSARDAFSITEGDLLSEGIAWSAKHKRFYLGSAKRKIISVDENGNTRVFVPSADAGLGMVVGLRVDDQRDELWAVSEQFTLQPGLVRGIFRYRLSDGKLLAKYPAPSEGAELVNDLVVSPDGNVFATASNSASLLRIRPGIERMEIFLAPHALPDPNGITVSPDGRFLFVAGWYGITRIDVRSKTTLLLKSAPAIAAGCIDGLYEFQGDLVGIQNCVHDTCRVLRFHLNAAQNTIVSAQVLESYNPLFEGITTGAIAGNQFCFVANTQLHKMGRDGSVPAGVQFNPLHVLRVILNSAHP